MISKLCHYWLDIYRFQKDIKKILTNWKDFIMISIRSQNVRR
nr:MAG TPA: hypothetical protein [Caudoviricetes sp.]